MTDPSGRLRGDFERMLALAFLSLLVLAVFALLWPFLGAIAWAAVMAASVRPGYLSLRDFLGGREKLAAILVSFALGTALIAPLAMLVGSLADNVRDVTRIAHDLAEAGGIPGPPAWMASIPLIGSWLEAGWQRAATDTAGLLASAKPFIEGAASWLLGKGAALGLSVLEFLLAVGIAGVLCVQGEAAARLAARVATRLGGPGAPELLELAASTVRSVSAGVIGTAVLQALLSAIGFQLAGIPGVPLLSMLCFVFALAQVGTGLVWIPAAIWLGYQGSSGALAFTIAWNIGVNVSDNVVKPWLIGRGSTLPLPVIFLGVVGGLLAWGFLGMFLGATLLALAWELLLRWMDQEDGGVS